MLIESTSRNYSVVRLPSATSNSTTVLERRRRRRFPAFDGVEPSRFVIDGPHRQPGRQRGNVDAAVQRVGRANGEQLDLGTTSRHRQRERGADVGLIGRNIVSAGDDGA